MELLKFPNPILSQICEPVTVFGDELPVLLEAMYQTMKQNNGLGLAANQVGILLRMFVMEGPNEEKIFLVNPVVTRKSIVMTIQREGCLSAPGDFVELLDRAQWVEIAFQDETGAEHKRVFKDLWAVCCQHEMEHLNGETFLQNKTISKIKRKELAKKWSLDKK
jgi:peptide deformylase